jgi:hypothetical protein
LSAILIFASIHPSASFPAKYLRLEAGKLTSKKIDSLLRQGKTLLKITREGSGKDTSYRVEAAN